MALAAPTQNVMEGDHAKVVETPTGELVPILAACCAFYSLNLEMPQCIGFSCKETWICVQGDCQGCKIPDGSEPGVLLSCCRCDQNIVMPYTCCERKGQFFCLDYREAFPCTKDVPNLLNVGMLNCMADFKPAFAFGKKVHELIPRYAEEGKGEDA